jgi:hypothetical protein
LAGLTHSIPFAATDNGEADSDNTVHLEWPEPDGGDNKFGRRGWTLQELLLSPRIVHYRFSDTHFDRQMMWQCQYHEEFEDGRQKTHDRFRSVKGLLHYVYYLSEDSRTRLQKGANIYCAWRNIVSEFSKRSLTFTSDKLPALSGVAAEFQMRTNDQYLAGIWREDIARDLL